MRKKKSLKDFTLDELNELLGAKRINNKSQANQTKTSFKLVNETDSKNPSKFTYFNQFNEEMFNQSHINQRSEILHK